MSAALLSRLVCFRVHGPVSPRPPRPRVRSVRDPPGQHGSMASIGYMCVSTCVCLHVDEIFVSIASIGDVNVCTPLTSVTLALEPIGTNQKSS